MGRHAQNARDTILDAAEDVVIEVGARHLTLDAVAKQAGVSKGGLLYHFPSKEALVHAMLDRRFAQSEQARRDRLVSAEGGLEGGLATYVLSCLERDDRTRRLGVALLAAAAHDPRFVLPYREEYRRRLEEFTREGVSLKRAAAVMLAVDGLRLMELLSVVPFTAEERNDVVGEIIALSREGMKKE
jgi:AcrR family transcriptional regulator